MKYYYFSPTWIAYLIINIFERNGRLLGCATQATNDYLTNRGVRRSLRMALRYRKAAK